MKSPCVYSNESNSASFTFLWRSLLYWSRCIFQVSGWNSRTKAFVKCFTWCCLLCCEGGSNFWGCGWNPKVWPFKWKLLSGTFLWCCLFMLYKVVLTFAYVDEILKCDHSNESCWAILSCGAVYYAVQGGSNFWVCGWNPKVWPFKWKLLAVLSCDVGKGSYNSVLREWNPKWKPLRNSFIWYWVPNQSW